MINIQNIDDNECLVKYLNPVNHHPARTTKADKDFAKILDFEDIKFPVKVRNIHIIEEKNSTGIRLFGYEKNSTGISLFGYENKEKKM